MVCDPRAGEPGGLRRAAAAAWQPAGLVYLAALLGGLAGGLWPEVVYPGGDVYRPAALPTLRALAAAQAAFWLLAYPLIVLFRAAAGRPRRWWPDTLVESLLWAFLTIPFYIPAVYLGDAVAADALRAAIYIACLWPFAWACGAWLSSPRRGRSVVLLGSVCVALGLPAAWYITAEFLAGAGLSECLWRIAPITQAWEVTAPRGSSVWPQPTWAVFVWPAAAVGVLAAFALRPRK